MDDKAKDIYLEIVEESVQESEVIGLEKEELKKYAMNLLGLALHGNHSTSDIKGFMGWE